MPGLQVKYNKLFSISLLQPYYLNGMVAKSKTSPLLDFNITPTTHCHDLMQRLDMVFKRDLETGQVSIYSRTKGRLGPNNQLYFKPKQGDLLSFVISLNNTSVLNHNDLPVMLDKGMVYYFNNHVVDGASARDDLHISLVAAGVADTDALQLIQSTYSYSHTGTIGTGTATLKHIDSELELLPKTLQNEGGIGFLTFDLLGFPQGKCELLIGGMSTVSMYHLKEVGLPQPFGIMEFSLDAIPLSNYRIIESDGSITQQRPSFNIFFRNRPTLWRYRVLLEEISPLFREIDVLSPADKINFYSKMNIVSNDTAVVFTQSIISDKHFEFLTTTPLSLKERYHSSSSLTNDTLILNLKKYIGLPAQEDNIKVYLPYPSIDQLDASNAPNIYSDVLLNL